MLPDDLKPKNVKPKMDLKTAREVATRVWYDPEMTSVIMDVELCEAIAHLVLKAAKQSEKITS